ncbi:restriction endonuclease subunit S [Spirochaetota bacterium]
MRSEFKNIRWGDFAQFRYGRMPDKIKVSDDSSLYPIYSGYRIVGYYDEFNTEEGELVIVARGVGGTGDVKLAPARCYLTNLSITATIDESIALKKYLYYYFALSNLRYLDSGSAQSQITISDLQNVMLPLPSIVEQQSVVNTLSALDDKIANNTKINNHLEQMAQAIFKSWFVDFEPFGGVMPDDWREGTLGEGVEMSTRALNPQSCLDTILEHYSIPAFDETRLPVFETASEIKSNKYIVDKDCFLISKLNPTTKRIWRPYCISQYAVCSTEFMVYRAKNRDHKDFYYSVIDNPAFTDFLLAHITGSTGSRQRAIPSETLSFSVVVPPDDIIEDFCDKVSAVYAHFEQNHLENRRLRQMRDTLLPRLISGELSISDSEMNPK